MNSMITLALLAPAAAISFGSKKATTVANPFESMPGGFGWAQSKGLAYSFGKPFSQEKFPDLVPYVQEAEIKHARVAMLAAAGFLVAENFHPLFGGAIDVPSYVAYQQTPLQTFWPVVVLYVGIVEIFSVFTFESPFEGNLWTLKSDRVPGDFEFDPAGLYPEDAAEQLDMQNKELNNGRLAMIAMAGMVAQELASGAKLF